MHLPSEWLGKPYYSLDAYLKKEFGEKVYKLSLDGGMTCPNRDGTCGTRGCIFCSEGGSGDFAGDRRLSITEQMQTQKAMLQGKRPVRKYIAYFQAYTNTYAPVDMLESLFSEALSDPEVVILSVATRPDCLGADVLELLERLNRQKPVWVELGLQTIHASTAAYIGADTLFPVLRRLWRNCTGGGFRSLSTRFSDFLLNRRKWCWIPCAI